MSRTSCYSLALLAALTVSSGAYARVHHDGQSFQPGARASAAGTSETDIIYRQCEAVARGRWGTNGQEMQTPRDFAYRACMFDHGVRNP
jgi:hypothetical protein